MRDLSLNSIITGGDCAVLQVAGEIDVYTAPTLREGIIDLVDKGVVHVITDMRNVDFLDSTGLGALVGSLKRLRRSMRAAGIRPGAKGGVDQTIHA